jgi:hypothetical protein
VAAGLAALAVLIACAIGLGIPWRRGWTAWRRRSAGRATGDRAAGDRAAEGRGTGGYQTRENEREPLSWPAYASPGWVARQLGRRHPRVARVLSYALLGVIAAVTGLLLGGYPGAIGVPIVTMLLSIQVRGRRIGPLPLVLGGLLVVAAVIGAIGGHLSFSGDSGAAVTAASSTIPQVICLIVIAGLLAAVHRSSEDNGASEDYSATEDNRASTEYGAGLENSQ